MNLVAGLMAVAPNLSAVERVAWSAALHTALDARGIFTTKQIAGFLGQAAVETGGFTETEEDLNYSASGLIAMWPEHFTRGQAMSYAHDPERIANRAYASRMGNGDEASGDGWRFRGRGLTQITGREDYTRFAAAVNKPLDDALLDWMATAEGAAAAGAWDWWQLGCNPMADGWELTALSERINGGQTALPQRIAACNAALKALGAAAKVSPPVVVAPVSSGPAVDTDESDILDQEYNS